MIKRILSWLIPSIALVLSYQLGALGQSVVIIPQGTETDPGLRFNFDKGTGFYAKGADAFGVTSGGRDVATLGPGAGPDFVIYTANGKANATNWSGAFFGGSGFIGTNSAGTGPNPKDVNIYCDTQYTAAAPCISFWTGGGIRTWYFDRTTAALTALSTNYIITGMGRVEIGATAQSALGTPANGSMKYCSDCNPDATCTAGGTGTFAFRRNGAWTCELL